MAIIIILSIVAAVVVLRVLWWWFVARNVPKYRPLAIDDNDLAMPAAQEKARGSLDRFLWAGGLSLSEASMTVRYLTPPVSHTGKLERVQDHPIPDIEDWVVIDQQGQIH